MKPENYLPRHFIASICLAFSFLFGASLVWAHGDEHQMEIAGETNFGKPGLLKEVTRTIEVSMGDNMRFTPDSITVQQGETIRFVVKNTGSSPHEMILGTADELREHAEMMRKMPHMKHSDPSMVRVEAGETGEMIWNFDLAGNFQFACLIPGHAEAGMRGALVVENITAPRDDK